MVEMLAFATALGTCGIAWNETGVTRVTLPGTRLGESEAPEAGTRLGESESPEAAVAVPPEALVPAPPEAPVAAPLEAPVAVREAIAGIVALLDGEERDLREVLLDERRLGEFDRSVYRATRSVGPGATATYGEIARAIGAGPDRARAVGAALGRNPFPIVVPCHRVLAADGALHGFSAPGGIATKRRMLEIERAPGFTQATLFA